MVRTWICVRICSLVRVVLWCCTRSCRNSQRASVLPETSKAADNTWVRGQNMFRCFTHLPLVSSSFESHIGRVDSSALTRAGWSEPVVTCTRPDETTTQPVTVISTDRSAFVASRKRVDVQRHLVHLQWPLQGVSSIFW